jgi:hypothetical protein
VKPVFAIPDKPFKVKIEQRQQKISQIRKSLQLQIFPSTMAPIKKSEARILENVFNNKTQRDNIVEFDRKSNSELMS